MINLNNDNNYYYHNNWRGVYKENHDWKDDYFTISQEPRLEKAKVETEKINKLSPNIPTDNITELNTLIYTGVELVFKKIGFSFETRTEIQNRDGKLD